MITVILGIFFSAFIIVASFLHSKATLQTFLNPEGLLIVLGGTFSIFLMTAHFKDVKRLTRLIWFMVFKKSSRKKDVKRILSECTETIERGRMPSETGHEFLDRALTWLGAGLKGEALDKLLIDGAKLEMERNQQAIQVISNLGKYPPALGMIGTVFGIIAIFSGLGIAEGQKHLGVNLAFAMTATLYGLITSNFIITPLAEFLSQIAQHDELELSMVVETVKLWSEKESQFFVEEHLELYDAS
ncbi:MAG: MotA/TolQ/ExbB proton channel family protein [Bdellovibrionales bacterium]|nr:MotA/TolQ/ExbB proton channel family protein [Bdellovibrionales bacterium]